jgi:hypothetical protein
MYLFAVEALIVIHRFRHSALFQDLESVKGIRPLLHTVLAVRFASIFGGLCLGLLLFSDA